MVSLANAGFKEVLDDLSVRFIVNLPEEELVSVARICFQIEQAHWYYEDFIRELNPQLPSMHLRTFCLTLFGHCPLLWKWKKDQEKAYNDFLKYKIRVPVRGAIMLNDAFEEAGRWRNSSGWGFPKGKINKGELDTDCAIREVFEETGFDISGLLKPKEYIEITLREQNIRLYIVTNVPRDTNFETHTRKEISKIKWHKLANLPAYCSPKKRNDDDDNQKSIHKYYLVAPFLEPLLKWIRKKRKSHLNSTEELIPSSAETNPDILKKNSETLKALLGIPCSVDTTFFDIPSDFEPSIKERFTFINDNRNISDDEQYNIKYDKNNVSNKLDKEMEEERIKGAERILELLRSNINSNANKTDKRDDFAFSNNNNNNVLKHEPEKNETSFLSSLKKLSNSPEDAIEFSKTSSNIPNEENAVLNNSTLNTDSLFSTSLEKQKKYSLEKKELLEEKINTKDNKIKTNKQNTTNTSSETPFELLGLDSSKNFVLSQSSSSSYPHLINIGGTAIEELDAQLLLYLKNVIIDMKMKN
ncbi:hypothetical protein PORY_000039 [Pneumocystis oryctolagi]|uniref:Uncharacterized protein n=1 Tax=Pneumocystis oryctolagi TaxID=42067 RepID=A0ACB7CEG2_9ASCO|nr:hypothetical protein PORY_000039 [Pneumocystis oryctolagi]